MKFEELHVIALGLATNNEESEPLPLCSIPQADVDRLSSATDIELLLSSVLQSGSCPTEYVSQMTIEDAQFRPDRLRVPESTKTFCGSRHACGTRKA